MSSPTTERTQTAPEDQLLSVTDLPGRFISFEGIEGSGKSTQLARLFKRLHIEGADVVATKEPGGTELGGQLRALLLRPTDEPMCPEAELLLYVTDRAQHLAEVIVPALARGAVVLCDRYVDATLAYQGYGRGLDLEWILSLHRRPPLERMPRRTLLLDLDPAISVSRASRRNRELDLDDTEGRFERERIEFHRRVREGYLELARADPGRIRVLDAVGDEQAVEQQVTDALADLLPGPSGSGPC